VLNETTIDSSIKHVDILLIEDNPGDISLAKKALSSSKLINNLNVVTDGEEAIAYLHKEGQYKNAIHPDLILLDLNLPKKSGQEVLAEIKLDKDLKRIPVVILTSSKEEKDILKSYDSHANCYITKPVDLSKFQEVVSNIENFWFSIVVLPSK
jgi:CheY-like chemotaxis protein